MKSWKAALVVVCGLGLAASAWAQCCHGDKAKDTEGASASAKDKSSCAAQAAAAGKDDKSACAGKAAALAGMPQLKYKVGDETTPCSVQAAKLAGGDEAKIKFVVGGTEYSNKTEAMQAYATELKNHLATVTSVRFAVGDKCVSCPMAAGAMAQTSKQPVKYRVASYTFADKATAEKAASAAHDAAEKVSMKYVVDGKEYTCDKSAQHACGTGDMVTGQKCSAPKDDSMAAKKVEFVVGETRTCCQATAQAELAKARIIAAERAVEEVAGKAAGDKEVAAGT